MNFTLKLGRVLVLTYRLVITKFVYHATVSRENSTCKSNIRLVAIFVFILWRPCLRRCLRYLKRSFGSLRSSRCDKKLFEAGVTASETPPQLPCKLPKLCLRKLKQHFKRKRHEMNTPAHITVAGTILRRGPPTALQDFKTAFEVV